MNLDAPVFREALRQGSAAAFDRVFEHYHDRVHAFLWRLVGDRAAADDLSQEVWLRVARALGRLRDATPLGPWLFRIARNRASSHLRWWSLDASRLRQLHWLGGGPPVVTPAEWHALSETERRLERAFEALPLTYREVALLALVEGLETDAIAQVLGLRADAVRQRLSRARAMIQQHVGGPE